VRALRVQMRKVFAGQNVGVLEVSHKIWLVSFMKYDLGFFDQEFGRVISLENPVLAYVSGTTGVPLGAANSGWVCNGLELHRPSIRTPTLTSESVAKATE
jgi:hypothetical protein